MDQIINTKLLQKIGYGLGLVSTGVAVLFYIAILMAVAPTVVSAADDSGELRALSSTKTYPSVNNIVAVYVVYKSESRLQISPFASQVSTLEAGLAILINTGSASRPDLVEPSRYSNLHIMLRPAPGAG